MRRAAQKPYHHLKLLGIAVFADRTNPRLPSAIPHVVVELPSCGHNTFGRGDPIMVGLTCRYSSYVKSQEAVHLDGEGMQICRTEKQPNVFLNVARKDNSFEAIKVERKVMKEEGVKGIFNLCCGNFLISRSSHWNNEDFE